MYLAFAFEKIDPEEEARKEEARKEEEKKEEARKESMYSCRILTATFVEGHAAA